MKKTIVLLLCITMMLSACGSKQTEQTTAAATETTAAPTETTAATTEATTAPPETEATTAPAETVAETTEAVVETSQLQPTVVSSNFFNQMTKRSEGYYEVNLPIYATWGNGFYFAGGTGYVFDNTTGAATIYDFRSDSMGSTVGMGPGALYSLNDDTLLHISYYGSASALYAEGMTETLVVDDNISFHTFFADGYSEMYQYDSGWHYLFDVVGNEVGIYGEYAGESITFAAHENGIFYGIASSPDYHQIITVTEDLERNTLVELNMVSFVKYSDQKILVDSDVAGKFEIYDTQGKKLTTIQTLHDYEVPIAFNDKYVVTDDYEGVYIYGYDGKVYGSFKNECDGYISNLQIIEDEVYYSIYNYDRSEYALYCIKLNELSGKSYSDAKKSEEAARGIHVLTGLDAKLKAGNYEIEYLADETKNEEAQKVIEDTLKEFPQSFLKELISTDSGFHTLQINVVSSIYCDTDYANASSSGVTTVVGYTINMHLAYTDPDSLRINFIHEMMHVIDLVLQNKGVYYSDWAMYVPGDYIYDETNLTQSDSPGGMKEYTPASKGDEEVYFIDSYSKSWPKEDRAALFVVMFTHDEEYTQYPRIVSRMDYIAQIIHDNFSSLQNESYIVWEKY